MSDAPCTILQAASELMRAETAASAAHNRLVELMAAWLDPHECRALAAAAAEASGHGMPAVPFADAVAEAEAWAVFASEAELRAYGWAIAKRLSPERRAGLARALAEMDGRAAA